MNMAFLATSRTIWMPSRMAWGMAPHSWTACGANYTAVSISLRSTRALSRPNTQTICGRNSSGDKLKPP